MPVRAEAIRIHITAREESHNLEPREAFWATLRQSKNFSETQIFELEAQLCRRFGPLLRSALLEQLAEGFRVVDSDMFPGSAMDFERFFFRYLENGPGRSAYQYQFLEAFTKYLEHRQELLRENPALRAAQERLAFAAGIFFATRIAGYGSLDLDLSTGSFAELAKAFENNFETFRVFLDAFVPVAFGEVFSEEFAGRFSFDVNIPNSVEEAFNDSIEQTRAAINSPGPTASSQPTLKVLSAARERAEWMWRLANGSLLLPFALALIVMFYGGRLLIEIHRDQSTAIQPILQHHLELLKEDRLRIATLANPTATPVTTPTPSPSSTPR